MFNVKSQSHKFNVESEQKTVGIIPLLWRRKYVFSVFLLLLILMIFSVAFCEAGRFESGKGEVVIYTAVSEILVSVETVADPASRARGLMGRKALSAEEGMLFVFEENGRRNFWMKNMLIPLDIIFISSEKKIVGIAKNVEPCEEKAVCPHVSSSESAQYVLEVPAGFSDSHGLDIGNELRFEYPFRNIWISCRDVYLTEILRSP